MGHHTTDCMFSHADVNDIRIAFGYSHSTDRTGFEITIGDISPGDSHVICFPKAATRGPHVIGFWIAHHSEAGIGTPTTEWTNGSPFNCFENAVVIIRRPGLWRLR